MPQFILFFPILELWWCLFLFLLAMNPSFCWIKNPLKLEQSLIWFDPPFFHASLNSHKKRDNLILYIYNFVGPAWQVGSRGCPTFACCQTKRVWPLTSQGWVYISYSPLTAQLRFNLDHFQSSSQLYLTARWSMHIGLTYYGGPTTQNGFRPSLLPTTLLTPFLFLHSYRDINDNLTL